MGPKRGPRISDAKTVAQSTGCPAAIVIVFDDDRRVALAASWGEDKGTCRAVEKAMKQVVKAFDAGGIADLSTLAAETPDEDGEAGDR